MTSCGFERPELAGFTWHSLRHCFVSHALAAGLPLFEVSRLAGHSSPTVTGTIYAHFLPERQDNSLNALLRSKCKHAVSKAPACGTLGRVSH